MLCPTTTKPTPNRAGQIQRIEVRHDSAKAAGRIQDLEKKWKDFDKASSTMERITSDIADFESAEKERERWRSKAWISKTCRPAGASGQGEGNEGE